MKKKIGLFLSVFALFAGAIWVIPVTTNSSWTLNDESSVKAKVDQATSCNPYASESWSEKKQSDMINLFGSTSAYGSNFTLRRFWLFLFYLPEEKQQVVQVDGQSKTLCFKELYSELLTQARTQKALPFLFGGFDFTEITDIARHQLLQLFDETIDSVWKRKRYKENKIGNAVVALFYKSWKEFITPKLKMIVVKMMLLFHEKNLNVKHLDWVYSDLTAEIYFKTSLSSDDVEALWQIFLLHHYSKKELVQLSFFDPTQAHIPLERCLNDNVWNLRFQMLKNQFKAWGLTSVLVEEKKVDVSKLVNSLVSEISELDFSEFKILKQLVKIDGTAISTTAALQDYINQYKESIQSSLNDLANAKVGQLIIGDKTYEIDQLLTKENLDKPGVKSKSRFNLFKLLTEENFDESDSKGLSKDARNQLHSLAKNKITKTQLDTALNQVLTARENQIQKEKEAKAKLKKRVVKKPTEQKPVGEKATETKKAEDKKTALTIGLATGGGVLLLAGGAGGFLYWFYKIKK